VLREARKNRSRRYVTIAVCIVLGIAIGILHSRTAATGRTDPVTSAVRTVTAPIVQGVSGIGGWFGRQFGWIFRGRSLEAENRRLVAENDRLRGLAASHQESDIELLRLRSQLGFVEALPPARIAAGIVSLRPDQNFETMVVGRGSRSGVHAHSIVLALPGLVGQVYDVAPTTSAVLLLTDSSSSVGAMVQRPESRATGICKGTGTDLLSLLYLKRDADVRPGDAIISSGLGGDKGVFPKGLLIGTVASVTNEASGASRRVRVKPAVDFGRLEEVYILP
jgi:rod shape-determining protein MreC